MLNFHFFLLLLSLIQNPSSSLDQSIKGGFILRFSHFSRIVWQISVEPLRNRIDFTSTSQKISSLATIFQRFRLQSSDFQMSEGTHYYYSPGSDCKIERIISEMIALKRAFISIWGKTLNWTGSTDPKPGKLRLISERMRGFSPWFRHQGRWE